MVIPPHLMDEIKAKTEEDLDNIAALDDVGTPEISLVP